MNKDYSQYFLPFCSLFFQFYFRPKNNIFEFPITGLFINTNPPLIFVSSRLQIYQQRMEYNFREIESRWQQRWKESGIYKTTEDSEKEKFYGLDMFPYPSGAGLHVGHPLGYIASDIYARYKRHQGFNVLHPMGYDSFGLPAEQYAIETGQHPAITTATNIERYRQQLDQIGFSYDWDREVQTSDPSYYRWTQWIFEQLFDSWYNKDSDKAEPISSLISKFENNGTYNVEAAIQDGWWKALSKEDFPFFGEHFAGEFTATDWNSMTEKQQELVLMNFRMTYLSDSWVNWCPKLGTVLANDEIKDGVSERGGYPVEQKKMRQWSMRISAYADRLLADLDTVDWPSSIKEIQRNWIGKSKGAIVNFEVKNAEEKITVFTTRPDTIFGVSFMVLAPEHPLVDQITSQDYRKDVEEYVLKAKAKTERDRQTNVKDITGQFTGAYAINPFSGTEIPIWIADYVLVGYGTGAIMAVPAGDERDWKFAHEFHIPIPEIFESHMIEDGACVEKSAVLKNSDFLNGLPAEKAIAKAIEVIESKGLGEGKVNYRLRDAVFSRQRYWGEPIPVYYQDGIPKIIKPELLPVTLPEVDKYLPTEEGEPPLARAQRDAWNIFQGERMEFNTMPGWAGSSWYFLRYMDADNQEEFCSREKSDYWNQVDLYIGGAEHATGHLLYSRFWTKFLYDRGYIGFNEPFKKMINQGMILGRSSFVYRVKDTNKFVSYDRKEKYETQRIPVDINFVDNDILDIEKFKTWREEYASAEFILNDEGKYICGSEVEKMSKSKYNVQTPDELIEKFGADTLRCYEMFLGPLEQSKPWDTKGINGVHNFLRKAFRLFLNINNQSLAAESRKTIHKTIKKITEDLERCSWNTEVSALMICVNELTTQKCTHPEVLSDLAILISPYAPHIAEEMWQLLGNKDSIINQSWPKYNEEYIKDSEITYPVSFNGKMRFKMSLAADMQKDKIEEAVLEHEKTKKYTEGKTPKKIIVVPGRIINIVV